MCVGGSATICVVRTRAYSGTRVQERAVPKRKGMMAGEQGEQVDGYKRD